MKKLSILLAVVVLAAAIGIGVLVNQKNKANTDLTAANTRVSEVQTALDEAVKKSTEVEAQLETAQAELAAAQESLAASVSAAEQAEADLGAQLKAAQDELAQAQSGHEAALAGLEEANAQLAAAFKEENAKVLGLRLMLENANKARDVALAKGDELLALVESGATEKGELSTTLDAALTEKLALETRVGELEQTARDLGEQLAALQGQAVELEAARDAALAQVKELETAKATADARVTELEAAQAAAEGDAAARVSELEAELATLQAQMDQQAAEVPVLRHGLGMVTSIGSVSEATEEKAGAAQVNTTVCSLVLDAEDRIHSVVWDVQQSRVQFSLEGKPVDLPEELLTKLEKGPAYGMVRASEIGKEWNEQIEAFAQYAVGKTVEEVLGIPVFERDASHLQVPDVEELKGSVTITVGDYLESLRKAAENAK
ncbi:MAG: hypothetical protein GXY84_01555 [Clostridiales bacterium]|nr:hypothetical protein [Clostridiales bacterium]